MTVMVARPHWTYARFVFCFEEVSPHKIRCALPFKAAAMSRGVIMYRDWHIDKSHAILMGQPALCHLNLRDLGTE
jgi:hypothetical protein